MARRPPPAPLHSLAELAALREALAEQARARERAAAQARQAAEKLAREAAVFRDAMDGVVPIDPAPAAARVPRERAKPTTRAVQFERDEQAALAESLSDEFDVERLLETDEALSFRQQGVAADVVIRLRKGQWVVQREIDLHGLRVDEAREALVRFLTDVVRRELRCVRVIHGKGLGSVDRKPVLKGKVLRWLVQRSEVLAFCQAPPNDGGSGALLVLLEAARSRA